MRSNNPPMTDICTLIREVKTPDTTRHYKTSDSGREVFCSVSDGVVRSEFYDAAKAGIRLSATIEVWEQDYEGETIAEYTAEGKNVRYQIQRVYPTGYGTLELSCSEVTR